MTPTAVVIVIALLSAALFAFLGGVWVGLIIRADISAEYDRVRDFTGDQL